MKRLCLPLAWGLVACQSTSITREPAAVGSAKSTKVSERNAVIGQQSSNGLPVPESKQARSRVVRGNSDGSTFEREREDREAQEEEETVRRRKTSDELRAGGPRVPKHPDGRPDRPGKARAIKAKLRPSDNSGSARRVEVNAPERESREEVKELTRDQRTQELRDHFAAVTVNRKPQSTEVCNSAQVPLIGLLQSELQNARLITAFALGTPGTAMALTKSVLSNLTTSRSTGISSRILQDQGDQLNEWGTYPRKIELSQSASDEHVMLYGNSGYKYRLSGVLKTEVAAALAELNDDGVYIRDIEFAKDQAGFVALSWPSADPSATAYSGYIAYNIPGNLSTRLSGLHTTRRLVSHVAISPRLSGQSSAPWLLIVDKNFYYSSQIPEDILDELDFLRSIDARILNLEFDRQGGLAISYGFDDLPYSESTLHFQVGQAIADVVPKLTQMPIAGGKMRLSFPTRTDHDYRIEESTDLKVWTTVGTSFVGTGSVVTRDLAKVGARRFWRVQADAKAPDCDRVVSLMNPDLSYVDYAPALRCDWNGSNYQPYNTSTREFIGKARYGFTDKAVCELAVADASQYAVCNWNGYNYSPYNSETGVQIGTLNYGYASLDGCRDATLSSNASLVCNWNGGGYVPYQTVLNVGIVNQNAYFSSLSSCIQSTSQAKNGLACGWNGYGYAPRYIDRELNLGATNAGYSSLSTCLSTVQRSSTYFACNWNGGGYQPYSIDNNTGVGSGGFSSNDRCLETTELSGDGRVCGYTGSYGLFDYKYPKNVLSSYSNLDSCIDQQGN